MTLLHHQSSYKSPMVSILLLTGLLYITGVDSVGICYGRDGDNLRSIPEAAVVNACKQNGIKGIRVYSVNQEILNALRGSDIDTDVDIPNESLQGLNDPNRARDWVQQYVVPYPEVKFKYVIVGNEVPDKAPQSLVFLLPALRNVQQALADIGLQDRVKATTSVGSSVVMNSYPPKRGEFKDELKDVMVPIVQFLAKNGAPLLASIYPYIGRRDQPNIISESFALFTDTTKNEAGYSNFFDELYDAMYAAVQKALPASAMNSETDQQGHPGVEVRESGWPTGPHPPRTNVVAADEDQSGPYATPENAATYYRNLIAHVNSKDGTPLKPGPIVTYLFAMFDENQKQGDEDEKHFGLFNADLTQKYGLNFNG